MCSGDSGVGVGNLERDCVINHLIYPTHHFYTLRLGSLPTHNHFVSSLFLAVLSLLGDIISAQRA